MKARYQFTFLAFLLFSSQMTLAQDPNFFIFLAFGQSNMEGQGAITSEDRSVDSRFQVLQAVDCSNINRDKANWYAAVPPLCRCWTGLSPTDYFGRTLVENLPEHIKIGVINVSVGGCRIELFDKDIYQNYTNTYSDPWFQDIISAYDGNPYEYLLQLAKTAQKDGVIKGILLHQGESNTGDSQWPGKVKKIYNHLMTDLELNPAEVPLLAGEVVNEDQGGVTASMNSIINKLPEILTNAHVISSSGCTAKSDNLHFDSNGYRELGKRYGEKMLTLLTYDENVILNTSKEVLKNEFSLSEIYPNPVQGEATITFETFSPTHLNLHVYDVLGRHIATLMDQEMPAGQHEITHDFGNLAPGLYHFTMQSARHAFTRKMIIK